MSKKQANNEEAQEPQGGVTEEQRDNIAASYAAPVEVVDQETAEDDEKDK